MKNTNQANITHGTRKLTRSKPDDQTNRIFTRLPLLMRWYGWIIWKITRAFSELEKEIDRINYRPFSIGQVITLRCRYVAGYRDGTTFRIIGYTKSGDYRVIPKGTESPHVEFAVNIHHYFRLTSSTEHLKSLTNRVI